MSEIRIGLKKEPAVYAPGEEIAGGVQWLLKQAPKSVEVRLFWRVTGRGGDDVGIADKVVFDDAKEDDTRSFRFTAPEAPYSFSGMLLTLSWAVEVVALPHKDNAWVQLDIAPEGEKIVLGREDGGLTSLVKPHTSN